jgi:hypothetical protein
LAVDTAQKRFSLVGLGSPVPRLLPIPQGSFAADDRALLIYLYAFGESAAETPSGGWVRRKPLPTLSRSERFRGETQAEREARIHAERIRMGIIPPDPAPDMQPDAPGLSTTLSTVGDIASAGNMVPYSLAAYLLPEDLAGLEALAAKAAQLTVDQEIALWLRLQEQRREEDDAAVLLLAMATIH